MAKKRTLSMTMEPQFDFQPEGPDQKKQNQLQCVLGSNFVRNNPLGNIESHPEMVEFELLDLDHLWAMGPSTRFVVQGKFEVSKPPPDGQMPECENCTEDELDKGVVQPNWFESMFQLDFFHGNTLLTYSSEIPGVVSFLNAWTWTRFRRKNFVPMMLYLDLEFLAK
jgi:hypothetical protein